MANLRAAIKADRHTVAIAIFSGIQLVHVQARKLASDASRSERSALAFINRVLEAFPANAVTIESAPEHTQRSKLISQVAACLKSDNRSIEFVDPRLVIESFCFPVVRKRHEVRKIVRDIWPVLVIRNGSPLELDAAALGLYIQVEHLLSLNSS